jgi:acetolactate synthase small subunit
MMSHVLSVVLHRQEDTLLRLTGLCYRRGVSIESLAFSPSKLNGNVCVQAVLSCERPAADQLQRHVAKLIDVVSSEIWPNYERGMTK